MISYKWYLSTDQPFNKDELFKLQHALLAAGVYLDLSLQDGRPILSISAPEQMPGEECALPSEDSPSTDGVQSGPADAESAVDPASDVRPARRRGRPPVEPENDITLGRVHHMRFMNFPVETIAAEIGVSRRTFYRRWSQIETLDLDPETPFSQWITK